MQNKDTNGYTGEDLLRMIANKLYEFPNIAYLANYVEEKLITTVPATSERAGKGGLLSDPPMINNGKPSFYGSDGIWHDAIESSIRQYQVDESDETHVTQQFFLSSDNNSDGVDLYDAYVRTNFNYQVANGIRSLLRRLNYTDTGYGDFLPHILNFGVHDSVSMTGSDDDANEINVGDNVNINSFSYYYNGSLNKIFGAIVLGNKYADTNSAIKPYILGVEDNNLTIGAVDSNYNQTIRSRYMPNLTNPEKCLIWEINSNNDVKVNTRLSEYRTTIKTYDINDSFNDLGPNMPVSGDPATLNKKSILGAGGIKFISYNYPTDTRGRLYNEFAITTPTYPSGSSYTDINSHIWDISSTTNMRLGIFNLTADISQESNPSLYESKRLVNQMVMVGNMMHAAGNIRAHGSGISIMPIDTGSNPTIDNWPASDTAFNNFSALRNSNGNTNITWQTGSKLSFYGPYSLDETIYNIGTYVDGSTIREHAINRNAVNSTRTKDRYVNVWAHNLYYNPLSGEYARPTRTQNVKQIFAIDAYSGYGNAEEENAYPPRRIITCTVTDSSGAVTQAADNRVTEIELNGAASVNGATLLKGDVEAKRNLTVGTSTTAGTGTVFANNLGSVSKKITNAFITQARINTLGSIAESAPVAHVYMTNLYGGNSSQQPMGAEPVSTVKVASDNGINIERGPIYTRRSTSNYIPYILPEDSKTAQTIFYRPIIVSKAADGKQAAIESDNGIAEGTVMMFY